MQKITKEAFLSCMLSEDEIATAWRTGVVTIELIESDELKGWGAWEVFVILRECSDEIDDTLRKRLINKIRRDDTEGDIGYEASHWWIIARSQEEANCFIEYMIQDQMELGLLECFAGGEYSGEYSVYRKHYKKIAKFFASSVMTWGVCMCFPEKFNFPSEFAQILLAEIAMGMPNENQIVLGDDYPSGSMQSRMAIEALYNSIETPTEVDNINLVKYLTSIVNDGISFLQYSYGENEVYQWESISGLLKNNATKALDLFAMSICSGDEEDTALLYERCKESLENCLSPTIFSQIRSIALSFAKSEIEFAELYLPNTLREISGSKL